ncbi:long chain base biosynthesis protein 1-like isoform X2 [Vicia villosa]|uniref:long chain base biosynthesis protein 1-like isoform X2 n=1 Tax=Vicia villosa TaxID=3911 RepID=UPI00273B4979|nr:long chain base biosynthesis protein 1-like isoform X2 [Vicia villosa]XP_058723145.1 long chain base biosynthesis protein 1-like isoform X2 [Vicia villosa]XP_058723146.1 long chain base biosynthesis protein 1-like isoform X2 [Vicia villosa]XP_058723147.1 long chain base biosynthesis protein 1-like isoform X2 [Vicia villosa]XP_058723148.1 long chain base biosynthesis protein 1-like isoform X2 [Vicia villosa]XP_058723149.1 long chain base biosynthesis protein 1-like isoform X2 [Vicia villosa]
MDYFKETLENITSKYKHTKNLRRYIVVEALYQVEKLDLITAAIGHALATEGGFCTGSARVIDHQRLSRSGYVFSASLPPYLASAAITVIDVLEENPNLLTKLKNNIAVLWRGLLEIPGFTIASHPESPIVYLRLRKSMGSNKAMARRERKVSKVEKIQTITTTHKRFSPKAPTERLFPKAVFSVQN